MSAVDDALAGKSSNRNKSSIDNALARLNAAGKNPSALSASYGDTGDQSYKDQLLSKLSPLMNTAESTLNVLERPNQAILRSLNAFSGTKGKITSEVLKNAAKGFGEGLTDVKGEEDINLRGTLNQDPNAGGRAAGLFDTIGMAALDPLTYATFGTNVVGKAGLKVIDEKLGKEVAENVKKHGIKAQPKDQQEAIRNALLTSEKAAATKKGAEDFTDRVMGKGFKAGALEDGSGLKLGGKTVLKTETVRPLAEAAKLPELGNAIKGTKAAQLATDAFVPLAKAGRLPNWSKETTGKLATALRQGRAQADNAATDVMTQTRSVIKGSKEDLDSVKANISPALRPTGSASLAGQQAPIAKAAEGLSQGGQDLLNSVVKQRREGVIAAREAGVRDIVQTDRVLTPKAIKEIHKNTTKIARTLGMDGTASASEIQRHLQTALPNADLQEANSRFSEILGVKELFKTNPIEAATDITVKAHRDAAVADTLKGISKITDDAGDPILLLKGEGQAAEIAAERAKKLGYSEANTVLGKVYAPKEVIDELERASVMLTDDQALKELGGMLDKWGKLWRGYATVPVLFGLGFHERNLVGNVFNMWLAGFRDVSLFRTTDKIGRAIESGTNKGLKADEAIEAAKSLSPEERQWVRAARKEGVIGDSFFRTDQATQVKGSFKDASLGGKIDKVVGMEGPVIRSGAYIGRRIEDNSRLAMFIDQMRKHGDPQLAAETVKKHLFDYSELTATEKAIKKIVPFYTYTRKNTPLQISAMMQTPGKFSNLGHLQQNIEEGASETDGKAIPQWALQSGMAPLVGGDTPIMAGMSTPFEAAMDQVQPLLMLASQAPGTPKDLRSEGGSGKALREILGNFGGGPVDLAKYSIENATGNSLLTGNKLKKGDGDKRLAKALIPLYGKGDSTITDLAGDDEAKRNARLLAALTGLSTTTLNEAAVGGEQARRANVLSGMAAGTPTMADLRKSGKAPKAKSTKSTTKKATTPKRKSPLAKKPKPKS